MENVAFYSVSLLWALSLVGCSGGGAETFPEADVDPVAVAAGIMAEYDTDANGQISKSELKKSKGLEMLTIGQEQLMPEYRLDKDGNGSISEDEFVQKLEECLSDRRQGYDCAVLYRNQPLEGATVTLVPESFMGDVPSASGVTDKNGNCSVATDDGLPGAVPGIYKVEITHPDVKISAKYNTATTLSIALDPTNPYATAGVPTFKIR